MIRLNQKQAVGIVAFFTVVSLQAEPILKVILLEEDPTAFWGDVNISVGTLHSATAGTISLSLIPDFS